jgi:hypothetical protein
MYKIITDDKILEFNNIEDIIILIKTYQNKTFYKVINKEKIKINNNVAINTQFICHRINEINELNKINNMFGVEIDLRDDHKSKKIILAHEPYADGDNFEDFLKNYSHNTLILNIKSERIEIECLQLMKKYKITNYFFLDSSFPMINLINKKYFNNKFASRYSEYECLEFTDKIKDMIEWIWIDCFTYLPMDKNIYNYIIKLNKKICIVSPELQGQEEKIIEYRQQLLFNNIIPDAICCKIHNIYKWL